MDKDLFETRLSNIDSGIKLIKSYAKNLDTLISSEDVSSKMSFLEKYVKDINDLSSFLNALEPTQRQVIKEKIKEFRNAMDALNQEAQGIYKERLQSAEQVKKHTKSINAYAKNA